MNYYSNICDGEIKTNPQNHRVYGKLVQTHIINTPKISDINRIFHDCKINHNKKYKYYTNEVIFKNDFETIVFILIVLGPMK